MIDSSQLATTGRRTGAMMIDSLVLSIFVLILFYDPLMALSSHIVAATTPESMQAVYDEMRVFNRQSLPYIFALYILYHTIFIWQTGMTLGKYILKVKVVSIDKGQQLTFSKSLIRATMRTAGELFLFYIPFLPAFFTPLKQTLHDRLAGSVVIDARKLS